MAGNVAIQVLLDREDGVYSIGDTITGSVRMNFRTRASITDISVRLSGLIAVTDDSKSWNLTRKVIDKAHLIFPKQNSNYPTDENTTRAAQIIRRGTVMNEPFQLKISELIEIEGVNAKQTRPPSFHLQKPCGRYQYVSVAIVDYNIRVELQSGPYVLQSPLTHDHNITILNRLRTTIERDSSCVAFSDDLMLEKYENDRNQNILRRLITPTEVSRTIDFRLVVLLPYVVEPKQKFKPRVLLLSDMDPSTFKDEATVKDGLRNDSISNGNGIMYLTFVNFKIKNYKDFNSYRSNKLIQRIEEKTSILSSDPYCCPHEIDLSRLVPFSEFQDTPVASKIEEHEPLSSKAFIMDISNKFPALVIPENCLPTIETPELNHCYEFKVEIILRSYPHFGTKVKMKATTLCMVL